MKKPAQEAKEMREEVESLRAEAKDLAKGGNKPAALEKMRKMKEVQASLDTFLLTHPELAEEKKEPPPQAKPVPQAVPVPQPKPVAAPSQPAAPKQPSP
mmetsp:Transcript_32252/g.49365  ORF Transcript_32252/g.49365 Transcript_32252/m.49365 type:complete len:99 (+) Transcript_32252:242-538(+)